MAEFDATDYEAELDAALENVMPKTWLGHARLKIHAVGFSDKQRNNALTVVKKLLTKYDSMTPERAAEIVIDKIQERAS